MLCYVHIPFCDSKCGYCAFNSFAGQDSLIPEYMESLCLQLKHDMKRYEVEQGGLSTLYIGGGTPSCVPAEAYENLLEIVMPYLSTDAEMTIEANPNSATAAWLQTIRNLGINRISFGVQSFDEAKLQMLSRIHDSSQAKKAVQEAYAVGFTRISLDLIYGTSRDSVEFMRSELDQALALPIDHVSLYSLIIEEGTPFSQKPEYAREDDAIREFIIRRLKQKGFSQYEVANFGKTKSRHNLGYWRYEPYLGIGAGAVGFDGKARTSPHKEIREYIADPLYKTYENLSAYDQKQEKILLGLRSEVGFDRDLLKDDELIRLDDLLEAGKVREEKNHVYPTDFFLADGMALYLLK